MVPGAEGGEGTTAKEWREEEWSGKAEEEEEEDLDSVTREEEEDLDSVTREEEMKETVRPRLQRTTSEHSTSC